MNEQDIEQELRVDLTRLHRKSRKSSDKLNSIIELLESLGWMTATTDLEKHSSYRFGLKTAEKLGTKNCRKSDLDEKTELLPQSQVLMRTPDLIVWNEDPLQNKDEPTLSKREQEVKDLLVSGYNPMEIAEDLGISKRTVDKHTQRIYAKYEVNNYKELMRNG